MLDSLWDWKKSKARRIKEGGANNWPVVLPNINGLCDITQGLREHRANGIFRFKLMKRDFLWKSLASVECDMSIHYYSGLGCQFSSVLAWISEHVHQKTSPSTSTIAGFNDEEEDNEDRNRWMKVLRKKDAFQHQFNAIFSPFSSAIIVARWNSYLVTLSPFILSLLE